MKIEDEILKKGFSGRIKLGVPLSDYTTYRIGGPAEVLAEPSCEKDMKIVITFARETGTPLYVLGGGSKVLAPDEGVKGVVMVIGDTLARIDLGEGEVKAFAGATNRALAETAAAGGFPGLEWIYDIPGRVGGSLVQNAGMNENSISDLLDEVRFLRGDGMARTARRAELEFGYRSSSFKSWRDTVIVSAKFRFDKRGDPQEIRRKMKEIEEMRHGKFPVNLPTCGSVFKRAGGRYPGKLIEGCGLGGRRVGGAMISTLHHNFIVNEGGATAGDVKSLVDLIRGVVEERTGVVLERELIYMDEIRFGLPG